MGPSSIAFAGIRQVVWYAGAFTAEYTVAVLCDGSTFAIQTVDVILKNIARLARARVVFTIVNSPEPIRASSVCPAGPGFTVIVSEFTVGAIKFWVTVTLVPAWVRRVRLSRRAHIC